MVRQDGPLQYVVKLFPLEARYSMIPESRQSEVFIILSVGELVAPYGESLTLEIDGVGGEALTMVLSGKELKRLLWNNMALV